LLTCAARILLAAATGGITGNPTIRVDTGLLDLEECSQVDVQRTADSDASSFTVLLTVRDDPSLPGCGGGGERGLSTGAIVGIVTGVVTCLAICCAVLITAVLAVFTSVWFRVLVRDDEYGSWWRRWLRTLCSCCLSARKASKVTRHSSVSIQPREPTRLRSPQGFEIELSPAGEDD